MKHAPRAAQAALLSGCFALLVLTGGFAAQAVRDGLMRSAQTVLPALLPFSVCANLMVECGAAQTLSRLLPRALPGGALLPLGLLCGYPGGAQLAASAYRSGQLTRPQAEALVPLISCAGAGFVFGVMGPLFGGGAAGALLYAIQLASLLLLALTQKKSAAVRPAPPACGPQPFSLSFCKAVAASLRACLQIVMYITVFSVLLAYVRLAAQRLPAPVRALAAGLLELSCGAEALQAAQLGARLKLCLASFFLAFGGLCICAQTEGLLAAAELSAARYLPLKALQGLFAAALSAAAGLFLPDEFFCAAAGRLSGGIFPAAWLSVPLCAGGCLLHQKFWAGKTGVGRL